MMRQRHIYALLAQICLAGSSATAIAGDDSDNRQAVPAFEFSDLQSGKRDDDLAAVLSSTGLISIILPPDYSRRHEATTDAASAALSSLCSCDMSSDSIEGIESIVLKDGRTTRSTIATATVGLRHPLPLQTSSGSLDRICEGDNTELLAGMEAMRDQVAFAVQNAFIPALDRLIDAARLENNHRSSSSGGKDQEGTALLKNAKGGGYNTVESIVNKAYNLEHFHVYSKQKASFPSFGLSSNLGYVSGYGEREEAALRAHTDAGLFLAFLPAFSCRADDHDPKSSLYISSPSTRNGHLKEAVFMDGTVAIMLGAGAEHWLKTPGSLKLRATKHEVRLDEGAKRIWYGMMHLVPDTAIVQEFPRPQTFADMKKSMALKSAKHGVGYDESLSGNNDDIAIGCGHTSPQLDTETNSIATITVSGVERRRLQMVNDGSACNNSTNFYCWMSCLDIPDPSSATTRVQEGQSLYCLDPSALDTSSLSQAVSECVDAETHVPGGAMNTNCVGSWQPTVSGIPAQPISVNNGSGAGFTKVVVPYCYGATSMFMQGFEWHSSTCIVYLFPGWVLSTKAAFLGACFGTLLFGVALEAVIRGRKHVMTTKYDPAKRLAMSTMVYGVQLSMGYLLMLVVMTYSGPLLLCVVLGLMLGHVLVNWQGVRKNESQLFVSEGITPCCQNDLGMKMDSEADTSLLTVNSQTGDSVAVVKGGQAEIGLGVECCQDV